MIARIKIRNSNKFTTHNISTIEKYRRRQQRNKDGSLISIKVVS